MTRAGGARSFASHRSGATSRPKPDAFFGSAIGCRTAAFPARLRDACPDARVPLAQKPEDFVFVVCAAGKHAAFIPTFGVTRSVTMARCHRGGRLVGSIREFKRT